MEEKKRRVLRSWLEIELHKTAKKMGLVEKVYETNEELIIDTIRCLDHESIMKAEPSVNYIITVIGLMWEHTDHERLLLNFFLE